MYYTYLLGWIKQNKFYYGVRYAKNAKPEDLGITYFSSSKYVRLHMEQFGEPDIIEVRRIHDSKEKALAWECKVLRRMRVVENANYLNRWDNNMVPYNVDGPFPFEFDEVQDKVNATLHSKYGGRGSGASAIKQRVFDTNKKKYGTHHTLHLEQVKKARESGSMEKYGTANPFYSKLFQESVTNPMFDEEIRKKHKLSMESKDWSERDNKRKAFNIEKYGISCNMNSPDIREKHSRACPLCYDGKKHNAGNFSKHMKSKHNWSTQEIKRYKDEN
jgi:hypothetical protein